MPSTWLKLMEVWISFSKMILTKKCATFQEKRNECSSQATIMVDMRAGTLL